MVGALTTGRRPGGLNTPMLTALADDVRRLTLPMPMRPGHVHCYLLREPDGWTLVDTGLALPDLEERLAEAAAGLDAPIARIVVTHFHPDHVGGAEQAVEATGAPVHQGVLDYEQCEHVWGNPDWPTRVAAWFREHGVPEPLTDELIASGGAYAAFIRFAPDPLPLREGDRVGGWEVLELPGHADGHICLLRDGALVAGDHLLPTISPAVGLYPDSRPDPLGDYLDSLRRTDELDLRIAYPGHGDPIAEPSSRARALVEHHRERLEATAAALGREPRSGYEVSYPLFGDGLAPIARRFAVAETLSHLERLRREGRAGQALVDGVVCWRAA
jgi:glyoxylase-like metal-dependent hydrolase (beta-lactamase superfamily II)